MQTKKASLNKENIHPQNELNKQKPKSKVNNQVLSKVQTLKINRKLIEKRNKLLPEVVQKYRNKILQYLKSEQSKYQFCPNYIYK